jgi:tetratricopeptide (TPR) repeat protein
MKRSWLPNETALDAYSQGDFERAAHRFQEVIDLSITLGLPVGPVLLTNLAGCMLSLGQIDEAQSIYERALGVAEATGDSGGEAIVLSGLGYLHQRRQELTDAIASFESAITIFRQLNDDAEVASALVSVAGASYLNGDLKSAADAYENALTILRRTASPGEIASVLTNLGGVLYQMHEVHDARQILDEALKILPDEFEGSPLELLSTAAAQVTENHHGIGPAASRGWAHGDHHEEGGFAMTCVVLRTSLMGSLIVWLDDARSVMVTLARFA